jgi:hypothetical protein
VAFASAEEPRRPVPRHDSHAAGRLAARANSAEKMEHKKKLKA